MLHSQIVSQARFILQACGLIFLICASAHAKTTRWIATGPGNWSDGTNWSNGVPAAGDIVEFDSAGNGNSTIDAAFTIGALNMVAGGAYTGTLNNTATNTLTVTGSASTHGTISLGANIEIQGSGNSLGGDITTNAFQLNCTTGANTTITGSLTVSSGGQFNVDNNLAINGTLVSGGSIDIGGNLTGTGGALNGTGDISVGGSTINLSGISVNLTSGEFELNSTSAAVLTVDTADNFTDLTLSSGSGLVNVTLAGDQLTVSNDLDLTSGRQLNTSTTNVAVGRDILGAGSFFNAATSTLIQVGRNLDVGAYTRGALLHFTGTTDALWTRAGLSNFGNIEISSNKRVSLSPAGVAATWSARSVTVNNGGTLDMNGNPLAATSLTVGGASAGTLDNSVNVVRPLTVAGNVDLSSNSTVIDGRRIDLLITAPGTLSTRGSHTVFNTVAINTLGTVNGVGPLVVGAAGLNFIRGNLNWDANDLTVAGSVTLLGTFTMSPTNTLTVAPTALPAGLFTGPNVIEGHLTIGGTQPVELFNFFAGAFFPSPITVNGVTSIEAGATLRVIPMSGATFNGPVSLAGTLELQDDATFNDELATVAGSVFTATAGSTTFSPTATLKPGGSTGTGAFTFSGTGANAAHNGTTFEIDLQSNTDHDVINFGSGGATGTANLQLNLTGPARGFPKAPITIMTGTGGGLTFNNVANGGLLQTSDGKASFIVNQSGGNVTLTPTFTNAEYVESLLIGPGAPFEGLTDPAIIGFHADPDGDGQANVFELLLGTDPAARNAKPGFQLITLFGLDGTMALALDVSVASAVDDLLFFEGALSIDLDVFTVGTRTTFGDTNGSRFIRFTRPPPLGMVDTFDGTQAFGRLQIDPDGVKP